MKTALSPPAIAAPFARYSHGVVADGVARFLVTSGQLGMQRDGTVPETAVEQAALCFANIDAILVEAGMTRSDVVRINAFVTDRAHMAGYMAARDLWVGPTECPPASTLVIVSGFTRPEFLVEVEVTAAV